MDGYRSYPVVRSMTDQLIRDQTTVYVSQLTRPEFLQSLVAIANIPAMLPQRVRRAHRLHRWGDVEQVREQWLQHGLEDLETLYEDFAAVHEVGIDSVLSESARSLMARYNLKSYDAFHVAAAIAVGAPDLVTLDADFLRVHEHEPVRIHLIQTV